MKHLIHKTLFIFIVVPFTTVSAYYKNVEIVFQVTTLDTLPQNEQVYITGDHPLLGKWVPDVTPLNRTSPIRWELKLSFPRKTRIEFKFTRGSWTTEEILPDESVPGNQHISVKKNLIYTHTISGWKDFLPMLDTTITGNVKYHRDFYSPQLNNYRDIVIWLPPSYPEESDTQHISFPVLYMHDGQNVFDPRTSFLRKDWRADEIADSLIQSEEITEIIIVGIYNTENRTAEYSPVNQGNLYSEFLVKTVKPFIDSTYFTKPDRNNTAVMGSSMGGIISLHLVWEYDDIFSMAGCLSPAFAVDRYEIVKRIRKYDGEKKQIKIYIDNGTVGLEGQLQKGVRRTIKALKKQGYEENDDLIVVISKGAEHNEMAWAKRIHIPMKFFFGMSEPLR